MPKIVISGISEEVVRTVAPRLIPAVAEALACPVEWISFEYVPSVYFAGELFRFDLRCQIASFYIIFTGGLIHEQQ